MSTADEAKWITLGHPSYVWRFGQDRRLNLVRTYIPLEGKKILDVGCGLGLYVRKFREFSDEVYGVDIDAEKVALASQALPNISVAPAESLPFPNELFDVVYLHEVIEHVTDDALAIKEAVRVTKLGGHIVVYAPNRLYPFETHGIYWGRRFIFRLVPLVNYLPDRLRRIFCPHARVYTHNTLRRLFSGLAVQYVVHTYVYPGFDNVTAGHKRLGAALRRIMYFLERTPLRIFGLSHLLIARKVLS
ncbi:MAG: class I SAM-dependent methyltransferase [Chloroflexi bacterium]|nr:class I SAM-dependent methyltransferase [Chloroflexota bacterium]MCL5076009.1 class I SAM-dependent methyltransferase [Chloroflexota bacterium]